MGLGKALYVELSFIGLAETMTQDDSAQEAHAFARMDAQRVTWRMIEIARAANLLPRWPSASGDDVGQQSILDQSDPVLQQELLPYRSYLLYQLPLPQLHLLLPPLQELLLLLPQLLLLQQPVPILLLLFQEQYQKKL